MYPQMTSNRKAKVPESLLPPSSVEPSLVGYDGRDTTTQRQSTPERESPNASPHLCTLSTRTAGTEKRSFETFQDNRTAASHDTKRARLSPTNQWTVFPNKSGTGNTTPDNSHQDKKSELP